jgi:hypothetical protein
MGNSSTAESIIDTVAEFGTLSFVQDHMPHLVCGTVIGVIIIILISRSCKKKSETKLKNLRDLEESLEGEQQPALAI